MSRFRSSEGYTRSFFKTADASSGARRQSRDERSGSLARGEMEGDGEPANVGARVGASY